MNENLEDSLKNIRKDFYRFRNGIIADSLRQYGSPYKTIFGLLIPQINSIAVNYPKSNELASYLWERKESREDRLLASCLFPAEHIDEKRALELISEVNTIEEADFLNFKLLRFLPFLPNLYKKLCKDKETSQIRDYIITLLEKDLNPNQFNLN